MSDLAEVSRHAAAGMITLRGDLGLRAMRRAVKSVCGTGMPVSGQFLGHASRGVAWMSPDELLILVEHTQVETALAAIDKALGNNHYLAEDVSHARAVFRLDGADPHEVLARVCPVDLHSGSFASGDFRRTRLAQVAAAFWKDDAGFNVICFRSVADYVEGVLCNAAKADKTGALG